MLVIGHLICVDLRLLAFSRQTVKNLRLLADKEFELDRSDRKSTQTIASTRKSWPNVVASYLKLKVLTFDNLPSCFARQQQHQCENNKALQVTYTYAHPLESCMVYFKHDKMSDMKKSYSFHSVIIPATVTIQCFINEYCSTRNCYVTAFWVKH